MVASLLIGLQQSVWFDEAYSITLAKAPIADIVRFVSVDTHPPLYYLVLKGWAGAFGWGELALRGLSVIMMGAMILVAALLVRRLFGVRAALLVTILLVVSPFVLRYGFEIRMYSMAGLIGISATYALVRARQGDSSAHWWWYAIYAALVALGMYTLYYMALLWVAHLVWLAWDARKNKRPLMREPWLRAFVCALVLFLPWLPVFVSQLGNNALTPVAQQMTVQNMVGIVSFWFLYTPAFWLTGMTSLIVLGIVIVTVWLMRRAVAASRRAERSLMLLFGLYALVPFGLITLVSLGRPMYMERYMSHVMIGVLILLAVALVVVMRRRPRTGIVTACLFVAVSLTGVANLVEAGNYNFQRIERPSGRESAMALQGECQKSTIIFNGSYIAIDQSYYFATCPSYVLLPENPAFMGGFALLHNTPRRVTTVEARENQSRVELIHYSDDPTITVDSHYIHTQTRRFNKVVIDTYVIHTLSGN
jgi:uncharacterized membrane protein